MSKWRKKGEVLCEDTLVLGTIAWNNLVGLRICTSWLDAFLSSHLLEGQGVDGRIALQHGPNFVPQSAAPAPDEVLLRLRIQFAAPRLATKKSLAGGCFNHENAIQIIRSSASTKFISWQAKEIPLASDMV